MRLSMDLPRFRRLPADVMQAFVSWLHDEGLADLYPTEIVFDGEGSALVEHFLVNDQGRPVIRDGEAVRVTDRVEGLRSLPPIDLSWLCDPPAPNEED